MAFAAQVIEQGPRNYCVKLTGTGVDSGVAFDSAILIDTAQTRVNINKIWSSIPSTGSVLLDWEATANLRAITLNPAVAELDFAVFGGLTNNAGAGRTNDLLVTGTGTGDWTVVLWLVKH